MFTIFLQFLTAITLFLGKEQLQVEVARNDLERKRGLSYKEELNEQEGMLFVYEEPHILSFWMKDTKIPLSLAFFNEDRQLMQVEDMLIETTAPLKIYRSKQPAKYALEMNRGWFHRHSIKEGDAFLLENNSLDAQY